MKRILLLIFIVVSGVFASAQDDGSAKDKIKKAEKKQEQQVKSKKKAELKGRKRHESIQTKQTKKRMKKHKRGPIHVDAYDRRPFFIKRWIARKER